MDWKFKDNAEPQGGSDGFWYDITMGGYITPEDLLADEDQLKALKDAIKLVRDFELALESTALINEF